MSMVSTKKTKKRKEGKEMWYKTEPKEWSCSNRWGGKSIVVLEVRGGDEGRS